MDTSSPGPTVSQPNISSEERTPFNPIIPATVPELSPIGLGGSHAHPRTNHCDQGVECSDWPGFAHVPSFRGWGGISPWLKSMDPKGGWLWGNNIFWIAHTLALNPQEG